MIFNDFSPSPILKESVQFYRIRHFVIPEKMLIHSKPYPVRPENCFVFYPRGFEITLIDDNTKIIRPRSVITGQFTNRIERQTPSSEFLMIMVIFKPGALYRLTGIPLSELNNKHVDLESVFPRETRQINDQLEESDNYQDMILLIENYLINILNKAKISQLASDEVFNILLNNSKKHTLDWLAKQAFLSPRQFERKANRYLGISPKHFARIVRFNQSYEMRLKKPGLDWLSISVACGFHDYQHLVKDYLEFASANPNCLFESESKTIERALGLNK